MTSRKFERLFGGAPRQPESPLTQREMDLAASIQRVMEEILLRMARHVHARTGQSNLCLAGGVALNCVANGRILREGPFKRDLGPSPRAGGPPAAALGTALFIWHQLLGKPAPSPDAGRTIGFSPRSLLFGAGDPILPRSGGRRPSKRIGRSPGAGAACGPGHGRPEGGGVDCRGRMEFGPRALGCRSILGDARSRRMQSVVNLKIKFRESFRPFAPSVMREHVDEYFEMRPEEDSPYMLLVAPVQASKRVASDGEAKLTGLGQAQTSARSVVPGHHPRGLLGPGADRRLGEAWGLLSPAAGVRAQDRLPRGHQHQLQRPGRAHRLFAPAGLPLLHVHQHGRAGPWRASSCFKDRQPQAPPVRSRCLPGPVSKLGLAVSCLVRLPTWGVSARGKAGARLLFRRGLQDVVSMPCRQIRNAGIERAQEFADALGGVWPYGVETQELAQCQPHDFRRCDPQLPNCERQFLAQVFRDTHGQLSWTCSTFV